MSDNNQTVTINKYDPSGRFNMTDSEFMRFSNYIESEAIAAGHDITYDCALSVDSFSEEFVTDCFQSY